MVLVFKKLDEEESAEAQKKDDAWSPVLKDGTNRKAKARLVILGYQDPDLGQYRMWSPTLRRDSRNLILSIIAHRFWRLFTLDTKVAF